VARKIQVDGEILVAQNEKEKKNTISFVHIGPEWG
jgi:hypothetical protein